MSKSRVDLYDRELNRYRETIRLDAEVAQERYGMTLIHSLPADERVLALRSMGMEPSGAVDFYNLGVGAAHANEWNEAIANFRKAVQLDGTLKDAQFNLALSYEKAGLVPQAREAWHNYIAMLDSAEEKSAVKRHLEEIG